MIEIIEVKTKRQLKKFVEFPNKLYKGNKYYCPPLAFDEMGTFIPKKNPAFEFCESRQYLAYKDKKLVGRIAGIISYPHCAKQKRKTHLCEDKCIKRKRNASVNQCIPKKIKLFVFFMLCRKICRYSSIKYLNRH